MGLYSAFLVLRVISKRYAGNRIFRNREVVLTAAEDVSMQTFTIIGVTFNIIKGSDYYGTVIRTNQCVPVHV